MHSLNARSHSPSPKEELQKALDSLRIQFNKEGIPDASTRIDRLDRGIDVLVRYADRLAEALDADFNCRPNELTLLTDIAPSIAALKHAKKILAAMDEGGETSNNVST